MKTVLLVPRRDGIPERDAAWAWCKARWRALFPAVAIYEGHHDEGPFNRSAAVNTAARLADVDGRWDLAIVIDSDIFLRASQVAAAIETAERTGTITWAHRRWRGIRQDATTRLVADRQDFGVELDAVDMDLIVERTNPISWSCCIAVPRAVWDDLGGFDERFKGWGFEDMAFQSIVVGLYGHERIEGDVYHLWHPRSEERIVKGQPALTASPEYITNARLGRRYMVAVRRDHGLHDRPGASDTAEMVRDVANLKADDAKFGPIAKRIGLPDWDDWWPTLEELREGAKANRVGPTATVTVILRTGGEPETWPERSAYLRQSLASLVEHVSGPIVQRVVYSDWGPDFHGELVEIAAEHGFYVAGEGHHGYTGSVRRLWRYIADRARGSFVFAVEDDFLYRQAVDLVPMIETLEADPALRQVALLRAAFYPRELEGDGILGWPADAFEARDVGNGHGRLEHRLLWTMNPSLFRKSITATPWPSQPSSERVFGDVLLRDPKARFAFWGDGTPWIDHIGAVRASSAY